jgi:hypothetical protein
LLSHPAIKRNQDGWLLEGFLIDRRCQYAGSPQIPDKQTDTVLQLQPMRTTVPRTLAKVQMLGKLLDEALFQGRNGYVSPASPMNEVLSRSKMPASRELCIARLMQLSGKPFKHPASGTAADFFNAYRRLEILCQHDVLLSRT